MENLYETAREIRTFKGHSSRVNSVAFSPDGKYGLTGSDDSTIKIWNYKKGVEICTLFSLYDDEWISLLPEGYYNSSIYGHKNINITITSKVYGIDQFYDVFYRPDIVEHKLKGNDISPLITLTIKDALNNPPPEIKIAPVPKETDQKKIKISYSINSKGGGIGEVRVFQNGKIIKSDGFYRKNIFSDTQLARLNKITSKAIYDNYRGIRISGRSDNITITKPKGDQYDDSVELSVLPGENEISICAFNKDNTIQSAIKTAKFVGKGKPLKPHLYILAIGIDKYKNSKNNLKFAAKDAKDFIEGLSSVSRSLYKKRSIHTTLLIDKKANRQNISNRINKLSKKIKLNDVFVFFVASHGVLFGDQYYIVTHDYAGNLNDSCMISSNDIIEFSKKIKSLKQIYVLDTCHAGGMDYIISGLYDARISVLAKKVGLHIYASSSSFESALDGYEGNGLFTYNLLNGLNNNTLVDKNSDQSVTVIELGKYTEENTYKIAKKLGHTQNPKIINWGIDLIIYQLH